MTTEIDRVLEQAVAEHRVPGVVAAAADRDGVFYQGAFGRRNLSQPAPMTFERAVYKTR